MAEKTSKPKTYICKVFHMDMDQENKDVPISLCVNNALNRKRFLPGQEVELTEAEINVLKEPLDTQIPIPPTSGIYEAKDPIKEAKKQYKGLDIVRDKRSGVLLAVKRQPRFMVEVVKEVK